MKAIETRYKGYRFRSRLEARWAVFFDALGLRWEYEAQGYQLADGTRYLPDFWLPELGTFVEVKGEEPEHDSGAALKCGQLAHATDKRVWLTYGPIPFPHPDSDNGDSDFPFGSGWMFWRVDHFTDEGEEADYGFDHPYWFTVCNLCGKLDITYTGRGDYIMCDCYHRSKDYGAFDPRLVAAYAAARSARFEHGEIGLVK